MSEIGNLTLYREKSTVHRFDDVGDEDGGDPILEVRANRLTIPLTLGDHTYQCVVRGQNIPTTLRIAGLVIDQFRRDPNMIVEAKDFDWESRWVRKLSQYEANYNPDTWVSIHIDGETVFSTGDASFDIIEEVESLAAGGDVSDAIINEAASNIVGALEDLAVEHDSQTAFVFTQFAAYHRAAILERKGGNTGSFAVSVYHPNPRKPVRVSYFLNLAADIMEALTMGSFLDRVQMLVEKDAISETNITPSQVAAARVRKRDLMQQIIGFERAHKVTYRPERPTFT
jgi:hypothetical protein